MLIYGVISMKILIVNKFLHPNGGSETYIFGLGKALEDAGHEVQFFGMEHEGRIVGNRAGSYTKELDFHGGMLKNLTAPFKIIYSREARKRIRVVLEDFRPDVVHLNNINFQITPSVIDEVRSFDSNIRILYTAHDYQWICPNHNLRIPGTGELCERCVDSHVSACVRNECIHGSALRSRIGAWENTFYRRRGTYRQVDTIICPSDFMNGMLSRHPDLKGRCVTLRNFIPGDMTPVPEPVPPVPEPPPPVPEPVEGPGLAPPPSAVAELVEAPANARDDYVLYFGRYDAEKGIDTLAKVAAGLPTVPFVCAGRGPMREALVKAPNITDVGFYEGEKLRSLIRGAKLVIFPSAWYENCPYSVMEAQTLGVPVIASSLGGTPELIKNNVTGILCEANDADAFVKAIGKLWNDEKRLAQMKKAAKEHAASDYDTAAAYADKFLKLCRGEDKEVS